MPSSSSVIRLGRLRQRSTNNSGTVLATLLVSEEVRDCGQLVGLRSALRRQCRSSSINHRSLPGESATLTTRRYLDTANEGHLPGRRYYLHQNRLYQIRRSTALSRQRRRCGSIRALSASGRRFLACVATVNGSGEATTPVARPASSLPRTGANFAPWLGHADTTVSPSALLLTKCSKGTLQGCATFGANACGAKKPHHYCPGAL